MSSPLPIIRVMPPMSIATKKQLLALSLASLGMLVTGCQTLSTTALSPSATTTATHPFIMSMPTIDRQGRIAYVEEQGVGAAKISRLYSIAPDGRDRQLIDQINGYIYAPAWSADGQQLAYSKQAPNQHPNIYIHDRNRDTHDLVVNAQGSNLSASFSPDGHHLLYSSTVAGNADIYKKRLSDGDTRQLTTLPSTEVQPSYAPDAQSFVYVSDKVRAGSPRLYRYYFATQTAVPITTAGYAASPQLSMDGRYLAYLNGRKAAVMTLATGHVLNLADTGLDEPARLSPSGTYAVYPAYAPDVDGSQRSHVVIHSLSDHPSYTISSQDGGVMRSPVWGR
ncbi:Xaa-Pro aminopeptidase [Psychrobacter celer]